LRFRNIRFIFIFALCGLQLACSASQPRQAVIPPECQDTRFNALALKGVANMNEEEYFYYLRSAFECDKATMYEKYKAAAEAEEGQSTITTWLIVIGVIVLIATISLLE
jgi:hypothetical protein